MLKLTKHGSHCLNQIKKRTNNDDVTKNFFKWDKNGSQFLKIDKLDLDPPLRVPPIVNHSQKSRALST